MTLNATTSSYATSATSNRLDAVTNPARTLGYDNAGNTTSDTGRGYTSTYDTSGRLATLTKAGATSIYSYDGLGRRVRKYSSAGASTTTVFVYDSNGQLLGEYDSTGTVIREYVWLGSTPVAVFTPDPANAANPPLVYYIQTDHLDTPRVVVDRSNAVRWQWLAEPFGTTAPETDPSSLGAFNLPLRFPGQYYDAESGLAYNFFRDYDFSTGRYAQSDPVGLDGGINTYAYAEGNPLSFIDFKGLSAADVTLALNCVRELFPNLKVPKNFTLGSLRNPITREEAGGSTNAFTGALTFSKELYGGPIASGDLGGLAITVTHEVMHANQNFADRFVTKWRENLGDESHNDVALQAVIQKRVDDCIRNKRNGLLCP